MARSALRDPLEKFRFSVDIIVGEFTLNLDAITADPTIPAIKKPIMMRAGFHDVQMPKRATNKIIYREGNSPEISSISPGLSSTEDIVLSRGLVSENSTGFHKWASQSHKGDDTTSSLAMDIDHSLSAEDENLRHDVIINMLDRTGKIARRWFISNAFVVNFIPGSDLNSSEDGEKSLESITLAYEDFYEISPDTEKPIKGEGDVNIGIETV